MNQLDTFELMTPATCDPDTLLLVTLVHTLSRKDWDQVFIDRAGNVVSVDLPEAVRNRRIRNLAHSYWCDMVMDN